MPHAYPFVSPVSHPGLAAAYVAEREATSPHLAPEQLWSIPHVFARPVRLAEQTPGGMWRVHGHDRLLTADVFTHPEARHLSTYPQSSAPRNEHVHVVAARRQLSTLGGNPLYCVFSIPGRTVKIERRQSEYVVSYVTDTAGGLDVRKPDLESALRVFGDFIAHGETVQTKTEPRTYTTAGLTLTEAERQMVGHTMYFQPVASETSLGNTEDQRRVWRRLMDAHGVKLGCVIPCTTRARIAADLDLTELPLPSWVMPGLILRAPVAALPEHEWVAIRAVLPDAVVVGPAHNPMMPAAEAIPNGIFLAQYGGQGPAEPVPRAGRVLANPGGVPTPEPVCSDAEREVTALLERRGLDLGVPRLVNEDGHPEGNLSYATRLDVAETLAAWARAKRRVQDVIKADDGPFAKARAAAMVTWFETVRANDYLMPNSVFGSGVRDFLLAYEKRRGGQRAPSDEAKRYAEECFMIPACVIATYERARSL